MSNTAFNIRGNSPIGSEKILTSSDSNLDLNYSLQNITYTPLRYLLETAIVGFLTALDDHSGMRVAAIIKTREGRVFRVFNDYTEFLGHAEVEGIVKAMKDKVDLSGAEVFVTDQCCYFAEEFEIKEIKENVIEEKYLSTTDKRDSAIKPGQSVIREIIKENKSGDCVLVKEKYHHPVLGSVSNEKLIKEFQKGYIVYYKYKGVFIPREYIVISERNGIKYGFRHRGCAVTLSFSNIARIYYVVKEDLYNGGNEFCKSHGVSIHEAENPHLYSVCQIIKDRNLTYNSQNTDLPKKERIAKLNRSADKFSTAIQDLIELDRIFGYSILRGYKRLTRLFSDLNAYQIVIEPEKPTRIEQELRNDLIGAIKEKNKLKINAIRNILNKIHYAELDKREEQAGTLHAGNIKTQLLRLKVKLNDKEVLEIINTVVNRNSRIIKNSFSSISSQIKEIQSRYQDAFPEEKALLEHELQVLENEVKYAKGTAGEVSGNGSTYLVSLVYENTLLTKYLPKKYTKEETRLLAIEVISENRSLIEKMGSRSINPILGKILKEYGKDKFDIALLRETISELLSV